MMTAEDKRAILDFISFYVVLGIVRMKTLCSYIGVSQRTIERWQKDGVEDRRRGSSRKVPRKLSEEENERIYNILCSGEYKDMNAHEVFNSLLDKGIYLASDRTFYRILKRNNALFRTGGESKGGNVRSHQRPATLARPRKNQAGGLVGNNNHRLDSTTETLAGSPTHAYVTRRTLFDRSDCPDGMIS